MASTNAFLPAGNRASTPKLNNAFARALATEKEQSLNSGSANPTIDSSNLFSQALAKTGGNLSPDFMKSINEQDWLSQQKEQKAEQHKEIHRQQRHREINQLDYVEVLNRQKSQDLAEIEQIKVEILNIIEQVKVLADDAHNTLLTQVTDTGERGSYFKVFFANLRNYIMLIRQRVKSGSAWLHQSTQKSSKAKKGMQIAGRGHQKTSTIQNMMHHERNSSYFGG
jgi:hypothetical protein